MIHMKPGDTGCGRRRVYTKLQAAISVTAQR